jgi:hypothetical protein
MAAAAVGAIDPPLNQPTVTAAPILPTSIILLWKAD